VNRYSGRDSAQDQRNGSSSAALTIKQLTKTVSLSLIVILVISYLTILVLLPAPWDDYPIIFPVVMTLSGISLVGLSIAWIEYRNANDRARMAREIESIDRITILALVDRITDIITLINERDNGRE
jgi:hypothetical protein